MVSSPLVAGSNTLTETATRSGEIVAVAVYYLGPISPAKRVPLALTLQWSWRVQLAQVGRSFGPTERDHFASTIARRYRTDPPSNSAGNPMAIPAIVSVVRTST